MHSEEDTHTVPQLFSKEWLKSTDQVVVPAPGQPIQEAYQVQPREVHDHWTEAIIP